MEADSTKQKIQDDDYEFPYHYVPQYRPGFTISYTFSWGLYYVSAMEFVLNKVVDCRPRSVADIGTGDGRFVRELGKTLPGSRILGIDYSERAINLARALNPELDFLCLDITTELPKEKFDLLTLIEVFEHIPVSLADNFARSLSRLLNENGHLIVTVPHCNKKVTAKHFQHFSAESLIRYFNPYFEVEEIVFLDKQSLWVELIKKIIYNQYFILRHWGIMNRLYAIYKRWFLVTEEAQCGRIYLRLKKRG